MPNLLLPTLRLPTWRSSLAVLAISLSAFLGAASSPAFAWGHHGGGHGWGGHGWGHHGWHHWHGGYIGGPSVYVYSGPDWGWDDPYDGGWVAPYPGDYPPAMTRPGEGHYCATPSRICELPPGGKIGGVCSCPLDNGRAYGRIHD